jgi:hypothetical protein
VSLPIQRTDPGLWERVKSSVRNRAVQGTSKGEWSARKAQLAVQLYKSSGGGYRGKKSRSNSLVKWGKQKWRTKSGRPSSLTGERYLPSKAIAHLSSREYSRTSAAKRASRKQFSRQPKDIARKTRRYRS